MIPAIMKPRKSVPRKRPSRKAKSAREGAREDGIHWIYGRHAAFAAVANPLRICQRVIATKQVALELAEYLDAVDSDGGGRRPPLEPAATGELTDLLPPGAVHQGIAVATQPLPHGDLTEICADRNAETQSLVVVLDQASDPRNVGSVLRSAAAFGARAVVVPDRHTPGETGVLAKAASGALETVPLIRVTNLSRALGELKDLGYWCVGLDAGAPSPLSKVEAPTRAVLVLGAEGAGLRRLTRESCDLLARIDITNAVSSLNLSNAAAIALYEIARRQR